jgi:anaerobic selenocysteine-containing dehydrogenase
MNGQPTAQNTRECGANGEMVAFRNFANLEHVAALARLWNVDPRVLPHGGPPTDAMSIMEHVAQGTIRMLWVLCTNPAVSMPSLRRVHRILDRCFLVVSDAFLNETANFADLVLPTALWAEKTGTFTNADRTVHLSRKAVEPPGEARTDLDILLEFARRMAFQDKDGAALVKWHDAEGAFEAWKECTRGQVCDYSGLSYSKLSGPSGIPWPCNTRTPDGAPRLYTDGTFNTNTESCETYGHDLATGVAYTREQHLAMNPGGRAFLKATEYKPPSEEPDAIYPFWFTSGRITHHWHTRTKTGRVPALNDAAPEPLLEISAVDAGRHGLSDGDLVGVESRRGRIRTRVHIAEILPGTLFLPFHYGTQNSDGTTRAANELTASTVDPISKQPLFKCAAVRIVRIGS